MFFSLLSFCVLNNLQKFKCQIYKSCCIGSFDVFSWFADFSLEKTNSYHDFLDFKLKSRPLKSKTACTFVGSPRKATPLIRGFSSRPLFQYTIINQRIQNIVVNMVDVITSAFTKIMFLWTPEANKPVQIICHDGTQQATHTPLML